MTGPTPDRRLLVDADLELSIDGVDARLVGRHSDLTLRTDQPVRLWRALRRSGLPEALRQLDQRVAGPGVEAPALTVEGPHGPVGGIGAAARHGDGEGITTAGGRGAGRSSPDGTGLLWYRPQHLVPAGTLWAVAVGLLLAVVILWNRRR